MLPANSRVAILGLCTDPRFSTNPGKRFLQFREALGVEYIVPLARPGIVRLFVSEMNFLSGNNGSGLLPEQADVQAWGRDFILHYNMHNPCIVGIASHETCGGYQGCEKIQKQAAIQAARNVQNWLREMFNINISVVPCFEQRIRDDDWRIHVLGEGVSQEAFPLFRDTHSF